jgi:uncharacterized protein (DUF427 family)
MKDTRLERVLEERRAAWRWRGDERPPFAETPGPDQISVWDFPRPPRVEPEPREVVVMDGDELVARSQRALRVLETASPPTLYVPPEDVVPGALAVIAGESLCEWKGRAQYLRLAERAILGAVAWRMPEPFAGFEAIAGWIAFYPSRLSCQLGGEAVRPQPGGFYGGWITRDLAGPFKGTPGSEGW